MITWNVVFTFQTLEDALLFQEEMEKEGYESIVIDSNGEEVEFE